MFTLPELRKMTSKDLIIELNKVRSRYAKKSFLVKIGQDKATHTLKSIRKYMAQIKTVQNQI